jgi:hypothetical protein
MGSDDFGRPGGRRGQTRDSAKDVEGIVLPGDAVNILFY